MYSGTGLTGLDVVKSHRAGTDRSLINKLEADKLSHRDAEAKKLKVAHSSPYTGSSQSATCAAVIGRDNVLSDCVLTRYILKASMQRRRNCWASSSKDDGMVA